MSVLCAWWLFVDSARHPELSPAWKFLVVGAAQTLDNARAPYQAVLNWCNPNPASEGEAALAVPVLQKRVQRVNNSHGEEAIICRNKAQYIVRADKNIRSKSASRVVFDELREQHTDDGWNAVSQTTKAIWSSQLWGISNAGDYRSVVLRRVVDEGRALAESWNASVETGKQSPDEWPMNMTRPMGILSGRLRINASWTISTHSSGEPLHGLRADDLSVHHRRY